MLPAPISSRYKGTRRRNITTYTKLRRPVIFAHRGSKAYAPENTLAAFKLAVQQHADGIELDAKLTADGEVVVMHDETVDRTTNGSGQVKTLNIAQLKELDAGSKFGSSFEGERIPTLGEVFETIGDQLFINVELTNYSSPVDDLPDKVVHLVKKHGLSSSVMFSSFNPFALIRSRFLLPKIALGFLTYSGHAEAVFGSKLLRFGPLLALHPDYEDVTPELIKAAQVARCRVHPYTVNQPDLMHKLFTLGVDGIFTDDPLMAQNVLTDIHS